MPKSADVNQPKNTTNILKKRNAVTNAVTNGVTKTSKKIRIYYPLMHKIQLNNAILCG